MNEVAELDKVDVKGQIVYLSLRYRQAARFQPETENKGLRMFLGKYEAAQFVYCPTKIPSLISPSGRTGSVA